MIVRLRVLALGLILIGFTSVCFAQNSDEPVPSVVRVMSFNILQGGGDASNVGFYPEDYEPRTRWDQLIRVMRESEADILCIQEPAAGEWITNAMGPDWHRYGSIYSRFPLEGLAQENRMSVARVMLPKGQSIVVGNDHWWPGAGYGPYVVRDLLKKQGRDIDHATIRDVALKTAVPHEYERTLRLLKPYIDAGEKVVLAGDFNEPSHLDWTRRYANKGTDRWPDNATGVPLRFEVAWSGSRHLAEAGLRDTYRIIKPDEVKHPGNTWSPARPNGTPGRDVFKDDVHDRIDRIYIAGEDMTVTHCQIVGECESTSDLVFSPWPSDHRAVLVTLRVVEQRAP